MHGSQARSVKFTHRLLADRADLMQGRHRFVDGGKGISTMYFTHLFKAPNPFAGMPGPDQQTDKRAARGRQLLQLNRVLSPTPKARITWEC